MDAVTLPPDLARFADEAVATGRYRDLAELVRAGVSLLRTAEPGRETLEASLVAAIAGGERDGFLTIDGDASSRRADRGHGRRPQVSLPAAILDESAWFVRRC